MKYVVKVEVVYIVVVFLVLIIIEDGEGIIVHKYVSTDINTNKCICIPYHLYNNRNSYKIDSSDRSATCTGNKISADITSYRYQPLISVSSPFQLLLLQLFTMPCSFLNRQTSTKQSFSFEVFY